MFIDSISMKSVSLNLSAGGERKLEVQSFLLLLDLYTFSSHSSQSIFFRYTDKIYETV